MNAPQREPPAEVIAALEALWAGLRQPAESAGAFPTLWRPAYTPLWPAAWPPQPELTWQRYGFAYGQAPQLLDGQRVARPWVRLDFEPHAAAPQVVPLASELTELGVQGVRPLPPEAARLLAAGGDVEQRVRGWRAAPPAGAAGPVRAYYRAWLASHGVIGRRLQAAHALFFNWLTRE